MRYPSCKIPTILLLLLCIFNTAHARRSDKDMAGCVFMEKSSAKTWKFLVKSFDTLHFAPGERIADIGAKGAGMAGMLSIFYDDIDITLEDIDSTCLNEEQVAFARRHYAAINDGKQAKNMVCHVVIGNDSSTTLPAAAYQKVFFINTYHEVTKPAAMLSDLYRILAPGGTLYAQELVAATKTIRRPDCRHIMPIERELLKAFADAGFRLIKTNVRKSYRRKGDRVRSCFYQFRKG